jgi:hypothetical protein
MVGWVVLGRSGRQAARLDDAHEGLDQLDAVSEAGSGKARGGGGRLGHTANV